MTKVNYLLNFSLIAIFLIITPLSTLTFAADDEDFDEDELPVVKKNVCWSNGDCYEGEYEGKNRNGKGVYTWANGDRYEGEFYEGKRDGNGTYIWANGDRYVGEYMEDKRDGEGTYTWASGDQFKGEFVEGKRRQGKMVRAKTTPAPSKPTLKSETPLLTPPVTLTKPTDELEQLENQTSVVQSAQEEVKPTNLESQKVAKLTEAQEPKTIANTESIKGSGESAKTTVSVTTDTVKLKKEVNLTPENFDDSLEENSATAAKNNQATNKLAQAIDEDFIDDFEQDYLAKMDKELTAKEGTKEPKVEEKITTTVAADEKPTPAGEKTIAKKEEEAIPAQPLTVAKLEDKQPVKSIAATPKIAENQPPLEPQDNVPSDTNFLSESTLFKWPNGDSYEGEYVNNERTGEGSYVWANGDHYTGDFMAGKRHGIGVYVWANGDRYEGEYVNDERHGSGTYIWANRDRYEGDFFKGQRHGKGKLTWADGEIYEGAFAEGKRTGIGVYISSGGDRYEGYFEDGKRSGKGILILADRQPKQLEFENELYTLDELEFKQGRLISAAAISQVEDEEEDETDQEMENNAKESDSTTPTPATTGDNTFPDRNQGNNDSQEEQGPPIAAETRHDSNKLPNDNDDNGEYDGNDNEEYDDPFLEDDEKTDDNNKLPRDNNEETEGLPLSNEAKSDNAEFQNNNRDEEY
jgi:hypothetical protein